MSFPRYPKYKASGVEWLGEVPSHWAVERFKWQVDRNDGGVWGEDPDGLNDTIVLRSTDQTVDGRWQLDDSACRKLTESEINASLLAEGDLLVTKSSGSSLHIGKTTLVTRGIAALRCCYSNFMQRIRLKTSFAPALAWYVMNNDLARLQFDLRSNSTTGLANLNGTMIGEITVSVPPRAEQDAIAAFLDRETAKIDALVTEQRRLIDLLKEKRRAVISHAVTKGLNPHAPMKPSGVTWLGDVPEHWRVLRLKRVSPRISGRLVYQPAQYFVAEGVPFLMGNNVSERGINWEDVKFVPEEVNKQFSQHALREGDVITVRVGAPGLTCVVPKEADGLNCGSLMIIRRSASFDSQWLSGVMNSFIVRSQIDLVQYGAAQEQINITDAVDFLIPTPPLVEQSAIATFLHDETAQFDALSGEAQRGIDLLRERRTALISAAVTGKIDVRGLVETEAA